MKLREEENGLPVATIFIGAVWIDLQLVDDGLDIDKERKEGERK